MPTAPAHRAASADLWLTVRHDFRQSAQSLWGLAPLIGESSTTTAQQPRIEDLVAGLASSLSDMIDAVTAIAEIETGQRPLMRSSMPLADLVAATTADLAALATHRASTLAPGRVTGVIVTDADHARAIVRGCLLTALKLGSGGPIAIAAAATNTGSSFTVTYTGIDPAPALARSAFVELAALPTAPATPFVGLGLALAARVSAALGGALTVSTDATGRHELRLTLPAA